MPKTITMFELFRKIQQSYLSLSPPGGLGWAKKTFRLSSPDRPISGGADSKYFIGPLKAKIALFE